MPKNGRSTQDSILYDAMPGVGEVSQYWSSTMDWLLRLKRLVEGEVGFTALKFANYLEAEQQLFRRMPELRAVCLEAGRLCRSNPQISCQVAERVGQLQSTWLAIETRLAEFKSEKTLLTALSGDLKLLDTRQGSISVTQMEMENDKHYCCTQKMAILDGAVHKKEDQLQQMLSVTSAISKLLDWFCNSDVLQLKSDVRRTPLRATSKDQWKNLSSSDSTTYRASQSQADGLNGDRFTTESSEILAQAGSVSRIRSRSVSRNANQNLTQEKTGCDVQSSNFDVCDSNRNQSANSSTDYQLSPELRKVDRRIAVILSLSKKIQASLAADADAKADRGVMDTAKQLSQLVVAEATLTNWQRELADLKNSVLSTDSEEEAIFHRAYSENIGILAKLTTSLWNRCRSKILLLVQEPASSRPGNRDSQPYRTDQESEESELIN